MNPAAGAAAGDRSRAAAHLELITSPGCHYCGHAREVVGRLAEEMPLRVTEVELESSAGQAALARWRVPFTPIVVLDGTLLGYGRVSERKLRAALAPKGS